MKDAKTLALIGAAILFIGVFTPIASAPILGNISYYSGAQSGGLLMVLLALAAGGLALTDRTALAAWPGAAALALIAISFFLFERRMGDMRAHLEHGMAGRLLRHFVDEAVDTVHLQWGWAVLLVGAGLIVWAGLTARKVDLFAID